MAQHIAHGEELRLLVLNDAAVGREIDLAVAEGIEGIDGLVGRYARCEVHLYFDIGSGVVVHLLGFDLSFFNGLQDGIDERRGSLREWYLANDKCLLVEFLNLCTHLQNAAALAVVVFRHVDASARGEVGIQLERLATQIADGGVAEFVEVMRQNLRRQAYGDTFRTLCQQQRELRRQHDGLLVATIVGELPVGCLRVEHHVEGELRQSCLDISWRCSAVARENVSPVALCVDEQVLLSHLHKGVTDAGVAMWVELHGVSHDVCHLVEAAVVHALHGVQDATLHRLEAVFDVWHGTFQNHIAGIVEEPVLIHARQVVHCRCVEAIGRAVVGVLLRGVGALLAFQAFKVFLAI